MGSVYELAKEKFYIDEIYLYITKDLIFNFIARPAAWIDKNIVDETMNMLGKITEVTSITTSGLQSGKIQSYSAWMLGGALGLIGLISYILYFKSV